MRVRPVFLAGILPLLGGSLLAGSLLAGCSVAGGGAGSGGVQAPPLAASNPPSVAGGPRVGNRTFVSTAVTGHQLVPGTTVTLTFRDATLSASAGCNTMSGEYHILGATLAIGDLATTEMGCQQDLMAQDDWLGKLLPGATVELGESSLTLTKGGVSIALVDRQTTNLPLEGTTWTVDGLVNGDTVASVPAGVTATIVIRNGTASIYTGCNWGTIQVTVAADSISFSPVMMTARACANGATSVEQTVLATLEGVQPYKIDGNTLTIGGAKAGFATGGGGRAGLILKGTTAAPSPGAS